MSCFYNNSNYRSAQTAYNDAAQATLATGTTIQILGALVCDTGRSIETTGAGFEIESSGLYRFSFDVEFLPSANGDIVLQLYNGTSALPCSHATVTTVADNEKAMHVETILRLNACYGVHPVISAQISGVAGTVQHVCASAVKLA